MRFLLFVADEYRISQVVAAQRPEAYWYWLKPGEKCLSDIELYRSILPAPQSATLSVAATCSALGAWRGTYPTRRRCRPCQTVGWLRSCCLPRCLPNKKAKQETPCAGSKRHSRGTRRRANRSRSPSSRTGKRTEYGLCRRGAASCPANGWPIPAGRTGSTGYGGTAAGDCLGRRKPTEPSMDSQGNQTPYVAAHPPWAAGLLPAAFGHGMVFAARISTSEHEMTSRCRRAAPIDPLGHGENTAPPEFRRRSGKLNGIGST